jgi:hypothetical protein
LKSTEIILLRYISAHRTKSNESAVHSFALSHSNHRISATPPPRSPLRLPLRSPLSTFAPETILGYHFRRFNSLLDLIVCTCAQKLCTGPIPVRNLCELDWTGHGRLQSGRFGTWTIGNTAVRLSDQSSYLRRS